MNQSQLRDTITAGLLAASALVGEHYLFQRGDTKLDPPITYIIGVTTVGTAFTWWAQRQKQPAAMWAYWILFGIGGAATTATYLIDSMIDAHE